MSTSNRTAWVLVAVAMAMLGLTTTSAWADVILKVDFNSNQDGGGDSTAAGDPSLSAAAHNQEGWSSYHANHEVIAEFSTADYDGITVTPDWPNTTDNRARQSIDRGSGNDSNWDDAAGDINLMTDFIGIDTRTGNGGNGDWDGTSGDPTYMTLALGGLPAGNYDWTSYHHDTEHVHGPFAVWISTDGGETFTQLDDGVMTDSTAGGSPDSGAVEAGPDANSLPSVYQMSFRADGVNDIVLRFAPYSEGAVHRQIWGMNGFVLIRGISLGVASAETPVNQTTDVPNDTPLSWTPGEFAQTHDVYVGTAFDDVNDADRADPMDVLVSQDQTEASYAPEGVWEFGQTYYWRVDEVNGTPDNTIYKGEVWSFTVEPLSYAIEGVVVTSNGTPDAGADVENAVNGSGLDADDLHSTESTDMWLASAPADEPLTITFEFDRVYKMHEMLVWNYNVQFELMLGFGVKDATVETSTDGAEWTVLGDVVLAQATAQAGYAANTTVDLQGAAAQYVRLTINSAHGTVGKFGLSEVRFMQIPAHAREPQPADEATDVAVADTVLSWRAGRDAVTHDVYLSTDPDALELIDTASATTADPGALELGATYYWRIDAVQDTESWEGDLWSFTTQAYLVVDDFESYIDDEGGRIYESWVDGYGVNDNGSQVGNLESPFAEQTIVKNGKQSMPLFYDNAGTSMSEAELTLAQNWTTNGVKSLAIAFAGAAGNTGQLYVKINGTKVAYDGEASDIASTAWLPWNIDLATVGNVSGVTKLIIGVEGAGATGVVYIDDIRLYPNAPEFITPVEPDAANLVAEFAFDGNANDGSGNGRNGTINGAPTYVAGAVGQAINFNGSTDYVVVGSVGISGTDPRTISGWAKADTLTIPDWCNIFGFTGATGANNLSFDMNKRGGANQYCIHVYGWQQNIMEIDLEWHHLAATYDGTAVAWYGDGRFVGSEDREINTDDIVHMGKRAHSDPMWPGSVDEVRIYNQALSAAEIAALAGKTAPMHKEF